MSLAIPEDAYEAVVAGRMMTVYEAVCACEMVLPVAQDQATLLEDIHAIDDLCRYMPECSPRADVMAAVHRALARFRGPKP